jgi:hypothetical protein
MRAIEVSWLLCEQRKGAPHFYTSGSSNCPSRTCTALTGPSPRLHIQAVQVYRTWLRGVGVLALDASQSFLSYSVLF